MADRAEDIAPIVMAIVKAWAPDPISRPQLVKSLRVRGHLQDITDDYADRKARDAIYWLRTNHPLGPCIYSSSGESGYQWRDDAEALQKANAEDLSRIEAARAKIAMRSTALQKLAAQPLHQQELF